MTQFLDAQLVEKMCHPLAVAHFDRQNEPIPDFGTRELALLESALNQPRQTFGGEDLYKTLSHKAAILYYGLIQNHPFPNGNKRIASASLLVFLYINDKWLKTSQQELAEKAIWVASAGENNLKKDDVLPELARWIEENMVAK